MYGTAQHRQSSAQCITKMQFGVVGAMHPHRSSAQHCRTERSLRTDMAQAAQQRAPWEPPRPDCPHLPGGGGQQAGGLRGLAGPLLRLLLCSACSDTRGHSSAPQRL